MNRGLKVVLGLVVVVLLGWALWSVQDKGTQETGPIKIGVIAPLSGDAAVYGEPLSQVLALAVEEINTAGGVNSQQLQLVVEDGKCNGRDSASAMQKLVNVDGVKIVIGGFCSSESLGAEPIATQQKVLLFSGGSSSPDLTGKSKFFVRNYPSDSTQGSILAGIAKDLGWKKVAFVQEQLDYPLGIYKAFSARFESLGGVVVKQEFPTNTSDFRSLLTKLRGENADAVFVDTQTPAAAERIFKQMQEMNWRPKLLISDAVAGDTATISRNAAFLEGTLTAEFGVNPENTKFQHLASAYQTKFGKELPYQSYAQTMYDAVYMIRDGVAQVGLNPEKMAEWLREAKDWQGASGVIDIAENGDPVSGHVPEVVKDGKVVKYIPS